MKDKSKLALTPKILFEDANLIVISKPAGLLSQGEHSGDQNVVDWLRQRLQRHYVGLIHRLDRNTSGIMIIAKRTKAAKRLTDALQSGKIRRKYLGWIHGNISVNTHWTHYLIKDKQKNIVRVVSPTYPKAKEAGLSLKPIRKGHWNNHPITLVEFELDTGRSHQIRIQAAKDGHPLLGDIKYGSFGRDFGRPALHSYQIEFPHPISGEILQFEDPLPEDMEI